MKYRIFFSAFLAFFLSINAMATEGMWIPMLIKALNETEMMDQGFRLTAEDIYSVNQSSLKDAVVHFGGGCTGEIVSSEGLLFTNHHCGYSQIQSHSTLEDNYLKNGFWAMKRDQELANPGLEVTFIVRMEDVTSSILEGVNDSDSEELRQQKIAANIRAVASKATKDTHYGAVIRPFFYGNDYYMFITESYEDVRLVGAPPSSIGKFGYDKDNWMWPRHTGDFSVFRVYADKDNKPAKYDASNVPYRPKHHFPVSIRGIQEGDFSMIYGFPGSTQQYLTSYAVDYVMNKSNPAKIEMRTTSLSIIDADMRLNERINLAYAAKQSRISNGWKKWIGESRGLKKLNALEVKKAQEAEFIKMAHQKGDGAYTTLLVDFKELYQSVERFELGRDYFIELMYMGPEILRFSQRFEKLIYQYEDLKEKGELEAEIESLKASAEGYFKNYNEPTDKRVFAALTELYAKGMDKDLLPSEFKDVIQAKYKNDFGAYTDMVFSKSIFTSKEKVMAMLNSFGKKWVKKAKVDPALTLAQSVSEGYFQKIAPERNRIQDQINLKMRVYVKAKMEMFPKRYWSDANSTLRVAYGKIEGSTPRDGMSYSYYTTLDGIMEKYIPGDRDYDVPAKLIELHAKKDYGMYANKDGELNVCFTASNHTTGGNSGSPTLNADGHFIGINFDRSWESTMSDIMYDPDRCRNIIVDARYMLFIIDKYAGAGHLVEEMTIIDDSWEAEREKALLKKQVLDMTTSIKSVPQNAEMFVKRGEAYAKLEMMSEAETDFQSALKLDKTNAPAMIGIAQVFAKTGKAKEAKMYFDKAVKAAPKNTETWFNRGLWLAETEKNAEAIKDFDKVIVLDNTHWKGFYNRGVCKHQVGNEADGCNDIYIAEKLGGMVPSYIYKTLCGK